MDRLCGTVKRLAESTVYKRPLKSPKGHLWPMIKACSFMLNVKQLRSDKMRPKAKCSSRSTIKLVALQSAAQSALPACQHPMPVHPMASGCFHVQTLPFQGHDGAPETRRAGFGTPSLPTATPHLPT